MLKISHRTLVIIGGGGRRVLFMRSTTPLTYMHHRCGPATLPLASIRPQRSSIPSYRTTSMLCLGTVLVTAVGPLVCIEPRAWFGWKSMEDKRFPIYFMYFIIRQWNRRIRSHTRFCYMLVLALPAWLQPGSPPPVNGWVHWCQNKRSFIISEIPYIPHHWSRWSRGQPGGGG